MLKVSRQQDGTPEIFYSIQGEGINTGKPAVFLRMALCNLACRWCDTRYTWDWGEGDAIQYAVEMSSNQVEQEILKHGCRFLVITGGEPMLQQRELLPLLKNLKNKGLFFEIETNGTILPEPDMIDLIDHWNVSSKLTNSGNKISSREKSECYHFFCVLPSSHFKFVVDTEKDIKEIKFLVQKYGLKPEKVILMPQATNREVLLEKSRWLVELCKKEGYIYSLRLHILLWGDKRGI